MVFSISNENQTYRDPQYPCTLNSLISSPVISILSFIPKLSTIVLCFVFWRNIAKIWLSGFWRSDGMLYHSTLQPSWKKELPWMVLVTRRWYLSVPEKGVGFFSQPPKNIFIQRYMVIKKNNAPNILWLLHHIIATIRNEMLNGYL